MTSHVWARVHSRCTGYRPILDAFSVFAKADPAAYTEEAIAASKAASYSSSDGDSSGDLDGAANGAANGHSNGHANGNGVAHGYSSSESSSADGVPNGDANGHANGNGAANGAAKKAPTGPVCHTGPAVLCCDESSPSWGQNLWSVTLL